MSHSFSATEPGALAQSSEERRRVLVTGAAGNIGSFFAEHSGSKYDLRLMVKEINDEAHAIEKYGELVLAELSDLESLKKACEGIDTVVHLAGNPDPEQVWTSVVENNITGTYNTC
ncbi:NAD-dependent epimerase/dehydratase family protein, partial [bacterium]